MNAEGGKAMTCPVCAAPMMKGGAPLTLSCSAGHNKISYYSFDNSFATVSSTVAYLLEVKGYRV